MRKKSILTKYRNVHINVSNSALNQLAIVFLWVKQDKVINSVFLME